MNIPFTWARACVLVCLGLPIAWETAKATDKAAAEATTTSSVPAEPVGAKKTKTKTKAVSTKAAKVKFLPSSEETVAQRRTRLKAECKGQVNAGACSGLTR